MENFPKTKKRGRPRKIPSPPLPAGFEMPDSLRELVEEHQRTDRHRANFFYAELARRAVEGISEDVRIPEDPVRAARLRAGMDWVLERSTVLSELGRLMVDDPTPSTTYGCFRVWSCT
jgi:hypothetical protein